MLVKQILQLVAWVPLSTSGTRQSIISLHSERKRNWTVETLIKQILQLAALVPLSPLVHKQLHDNSLLICLKDKNVNYQMRINLFEIEECELLVLAAVWVGIFILTLIEWLDSIVRIYSAKESCSVVSCVRSFICSSIVSFIFSYVVGRWSCGGS